MTDAIKNATKKDVLLTGLTVLLPLLAGWLWNTQEKLAETRAESRAAFATIQEFEATVKAADARSTANQMIMQAMLLGRAQDARLETPRVPWRAPSSSEAEVYEGWDAVPEAAPSVEAAPDEPPAPAPPPPEQRVPLDAYIEQKVQQHGRR